MKKLKKILLIALAAVLALVIGFFVFLMIPRHAENPAQAAASTEAVAVSAMGDDYFFDGPGEDALLIFYPGAPVDALAYGPLLKKIAAGGIDCYAVQMPMNMAILGQDRADDIISRMPYSRYLIGGHSMGGLAAAGYAGKHPDQVSGVVLLAAYPGNEVTQPVLSVYGTEDGVLNPGRLEKGRGLVRDAYEEHCIPGANHANFGNYGTQFRDGTAAISADEQQQITADYILGMFR
ncbi:MAG: alpha/beta hydrolase [Clostridia bacterium]|nr:alpha/beta hydrolase [Clostridia bacterium]